VPSLPATSLPAAPLPPGREPAGPTAWVVRGGQSLWSIAEAVAGSRGATPAQVAGYWVALVRDNPRPDPDLIHPGEVVDLPPYQA
jgi:nucleoid-associated protein YgaU